MMQLHLVVPGLCGPLADLDPLDANPAIDELIKLLARADQNNHLNNQQANGFHAVLAELFQLDTNKPLPSAELTLLGYDAEHPSEYGNKYTPGHWFHADPVHLLADIDQAFLRDAESLDIDVAESKQLLETVSQHFSEDGLQWLAMSKDHWFLRKDDATDIKTTPLFDVIGRNINFFMPEGEDEWYWKRFLNESQMLFHQSEVNVARDRRGLLPVNSLWLWGEGSLPEVGQTKIKKIYTDNKLSRGLAKHHSIECSALDNVTAVSDSIAYTQQPLVVLDELFTISCYGDSGAWLERFEPFFKHWLQPLIQHAFSQGASINLYPCNGSRYRISPGNKFRLFRRRNLKEHIHTYDSSL